jgi:hypothetical protein
MVKRQKAPPTSLADLSNSHIEIQSKKSKMEIDSEDLTKIIIKDVDKKYIENPILLKIDIEDHIKIKLIKTELTARGHLIITVEKDDIE